MGVLKEIDYMVNEARKDPDILVREFVTQSREKYGSYAHCAGFMEVMLASAIRGMSPKRKRDYLTTLAERIVLDKQYG